MVSRYYRSKNLDLLLSISHSFICEILYTIVLVETLHILELGVFGCSVIRDRIKVDSSIPGCDFDQCYWRT